MDFLGRPRGDGVADGDRDFFGLPLGDGVAAGDRDFLGRPRGDFTGPSSEAGDFLGRPRGDAAPGALGLGVLLGRPRGGVDFSSAALGDTSFKCAIFVEITFGDFGVLGVDLAGPGSALGDLGVFGPGVGRLSGVTGFFMGVLSIGLSDGVGLEDWAWTSVGWACDVCGVSFSGEGTSPCGLPMLIPRLRAR